MPNKDDAPKNPSSEDPQKPAEGPPSPADGSSGDPNDQGKQGTDTLESLASRKVQALMDTSQAYMEQGRYAELDPKVIQLLTNYDRLTQTPNPGVGAEGVAPASGVDPGSSDPNAPAQRKSYEQLGREAQSKEVLTKITGQVEAGLVKSMWAEDVRSLYAELGKTQVTTEQFASVDFTDQKRFPPNQTGYTVWRTAATALRVQMAGGKGSATGEDEDGNSSALDADRTKAAAGGKQPNPASSSPALTDITKATERKKAGKLDGKEYLDIVRRGTSPGILK